MSLQQEIVPQVNYIRVGKSTLQNIESTITWYTYIVVLDVGKFLVKWLKEVSVENVMYLHN